MLMNLALSQVFSTWGLLVLVSLSTNDPLGFPMGLEEDS